MIDWFNYNQGFVMAILTAVYVGATILICIFNNKSSKASLEQLKEMQRSQEQNVRIQLFEKRHELYNILNSWNHISKRAFSKTMLTATGDILHPKKAFMEIMFDETEFKTIESTETICGSTGDYLRMLNDRLQHFNTIKPKDEEHTRTLEQAKNHFEYRIYKISECLNRTKNERTRLEFAKHIYSDISFDKLYSFADAFSNTVSLVSDQNIRALEEAHKNFEETKILEKMEKYLKL
ncbi:MAG: hypothetical protein FWE05_03790 [Defluviitaleaceae bacterium]|nr:hypothetical protein [Defluviitaleaceae bacterium]